MAYEIEIFDRSKLEAFRQAFRQLAPATDPAIQARREWWCFDNPYGGAFAIIRTEDEIAATCYLGGKRIKLNGREFLGFEIGETATEPAHQRKGLFSKLVKTCSTFATDQDRAPIYGTPNRQSTPGYAKLEFSIIDSADSWLFLVASHSYWLNVNTGLIGNIFLTSKMHEISGEDYINATVNFDRLNASDLSYLSWRLAGSPANYRYFRGAWGSEDFVCAVKAGVLGRHPIIVVAEYYLNGVKPSSHTAAAILRRAVWQHYDPTQYLGIYFHGRRKGRLDDLRLAAAGVLPHRQLPVCATGICGDDAQADWFKNFQLSDCDIG